MQKYDRLRSSNRLYGSIPSNISGLIHFVTTLDLSSNIFSGEIPPAFANCSFSNRLKLDNNRLTGSIPLVLTFLDRMKSFSVSNNLLSGPIPPFNATLTAENFAHNPGLCGKPLDPCQSTSGGPKTGIIAGAAVGGVTVAAIGVAIGMFFYYRRMAATRKKDDDPDGNKWAKSLKGEKCVSVFEKEVSKMKLNDLMKATNSFNKIIPSDPEEQGL
ncbi:leucine-rich repeat receptor-like protein kinase [Hibiscus syriacus]|uniref:Leucine-rich repeat receptor-like protein kinase n=1 Tax=Hibiscus syriacus TaxID=106335 RepID=A0A6A3A6L2_HIBSY|nr:leucine-rich repeat receptor-like protein kinase [Hibiscus syriacus]